MKSELQNSLAYRMGMLRGALCERIRQADQLLNFTDRLEALAVKCDEPKGMETALDELEALAGVGKSQERKRANHGQGFKQS